ncbi:hypothetical protein J6590_091163, partial [Homalodisca vitripennis]
SSVTISQVNVVQTTDGQFTQEPRDMSSVTINQGNVVQTTDGQFTARTKGHVSTTTMSSRRSSVTINQVNVVKTTDGQLTQEPRDLELGLLTLPYLYILDIVLYCRSKGKLAQGKDVHQHGTRGRENFRVQQHRTAAYERLPSEVGVKLIKKIPEEIK